ncbi:MAG TPA: chemotaxis protein [Opitutaceae bacterium]|nr:chemotaxis protein [Opitutaceae bacterium]
MQTIAPAKQAILLESGTNEVEFIEFFLAGESYGVNVSKVQRVIALANCHITTVAQAPHGVMGVIHVQDKPVLLVDLHTALALPPPAQAADAERQLVMVTRFNKRTTAFLIDGISKIHRTSWSDFEPMTAGLAAEGAGYTTGSIRIGERIVLVLDLERLMLDFTPDDERPAAPPPADETTRRRRENVKIVYAEDSKMIRKFTLDVLHGAGFANITVFENGLEADAHLAALRRKALDEGKALNDYVDLIVTDIEMPKMDGLTLCRNVKNAGGEHIPAVVVYSSLINEEMSRKCLSVGADAQLSKPHGEEIIAIVDQLCGSAAD